MGLMECALINRSQQSRTANPSARREQLVRIRKADPGLGGDVFSASRCIVTNSNRNPGYRISRQAGRMDCHQKVQSGHRVLYGDRCGGSGHSLMSLMLYVFLAMVLILPVNGQPDPCDNILVVDDEWRDLSAPQGGKTNHCDEKQFVPDKWYTFHLRGQPAWVPTECIKSNMCGASVGMRVDLLGQSLPSIGENITAALCGAYDVLGKYDCCVLRTTVNIVRCEDDRLGYNFPTPIDRCPVAVCTQGKNVEVPPEAKAKMGEDVNKPKDSSVTDIPETTPDGSDSTTAASTTADVIVDDTTSDLGESTESPAPPQPIMQQTTSETSTSDADEEQSTTAVVEETTSSISSTNTPSKVDVDSEGTDSTTTGVTDIVTESVTDPEASSTLVYEINTLTTASEDRQEPSDLTTAETTPDQASTESTESLITGQNQETKSDNIQDASSDANLLSSTDLSTSEQPMTTATELQPTTQGISDEELSSTSQSSQETDGKQSHGSDDEAAASTSYDLSDTTSSVSFSTEVHEPAEHEETSSISTSTVTDTTNTETTPTSTESLLETTRHTTERTHLISSSSTTTERKGVTTSKQGDNDDVIITETLRFVFQGQPQNIAPVAKVQELLGDFLRRAKDKADWTYELFSVSEAINYENISTYMDFSLVRQGNDLKAGTTFFEEHQLNQFVSENSNMTLLALCRASKNCQENNYNFLTPLASVFEQNAPAFTAIIVLCAICLLILILVVLYTRFSKRGSWKAPEPEPNPSPENSRQVNGSQSPFTDAQIMKDEMVDNASTSYNGSAKDGDTNLSGTWVIPLDQDSGNQNTVVSITTEDTKF